MPVDSSIRDGGKIYNPLVAKASKVITRMTSKWGVNCDIYYCQNDINTLDMYGINTNELVYLDTPDVEGIKLCVPEYWENMGANEFNFSSHEAEEIDASIYTLPEVKIPLLSKVVITEANTNRVYIIRKTLLEYYNLNELFLQYILDIMPSDDGDSYVADLVTDFEDLSIYNGDQGAVDSTSILPDGVMIDKL